MSKQLLPALDRLNIALLQVDSLLCATIADNEGGFWLLDQPMQTSYLSAISALNNAAKAATDDLYAAVGGEGAQS